jgi:N-acetylmuramoyl-L-alanine amidase
MAPGAISASGKTEFSYNLALARELARQLQTLNLTPHLIGDQGDISLLTQRTRLARGLQLFISIHHDSVQPQYLAQARRFHGYALFVSHKNPYPAQSLACADKIARALQAIGETPTTHHAEAIAGENRPWADQALGIYWFDDLVVLKSASQPAVLIENGVIVNPDEEARIARPEIRAVHAAALARGIAQCVRGN